jgi:hypothetical protein
VIVVTCYWDEVKRRTSTDLSAAALWNHNRWPHKKLGSALNLLGKDSQPWDRYYETITLDLKQVLVASVLLILLRCIFLSGLLEYRIITWSEAG